MKRTWTGLLLIVATAAAAQVAPKEAIKEIITNGPVAKESLTGPARKIMRLSDGRIFASFDVKHAEGGAPALFAASKDKPGWTNVSAKLGDFLAKSVASETGPAGTYVAFVDDSTKAGTIVRFPDPLGHREEAAIFGGLTPSSADITDTYLAASKGEDSTNSVAYAWRAADTGDLYLGFSPDGLSFDKARVVAKNDNLASGPILALHNQYILLTFLSRDKSLRPERAPSDGAYQVWMESWDGGKSWTDPQPLFGTKITEFPKAEAVLPGATPKSFQPLFAAGGSREASNALAWPQAEIGARIFITTAQTLLTKEGEAPADGRSVAGVVSFKDLSDGPGAPWQHVFASEFNAKINDPVQRRNSSFQYSALPGSSVRAVAYLQQAPDDNAGVGDRVAVAVSINTGKSFDRTVKFTPAVLGLKANERIVFTTSTCLMVKGNGGVYLDAAYLEPRTGKVRVAQLPLGVNVKDLPPSLFNVNARWP